MGAGLQIMFIDTPIPFDERDEYTQGFMVTKDVTHLKDHVDVSLKII